MGMARNQAYGKQAPARELTVSSLAGTGAELIAPEYGCAPGGTVECHGFLTIIGLGRAEFGWHTLPSAQRAFGSLALAIGETVGPECAYKVKEESPGERRE